MPLIDPVPAPQGLSLVDLALLEVASDIEDDYQRKIVLARKYHKGVQGAGVTDRLREFLPSVDQGEEFRLNICRVIVSAMTERMRLIGFDSSDTKRIQWAADTFDECKGPAIELELYETTVRDGEAFIVIDVDTEEKVVTWHVNQRYTSVDVGGDGDGCRAFYQNDDPNQKLLAITKEWSVSDARGRLVRNRNVYFPDKIVRQRHDGIQWVTYKEDDWKSPDGKPLGIPAAHFWNAGFKREAEDAFTPQDAVNKTFLDLLTCSDVAAFRVYVSLGWIPTTDGKPPEEDGSNWLAIEPGHIVGTDKPKSEVEFKSIEPVELEPVIKVVQQNILWASMVTNTPATRFISTKLIASDETLKQQEEPLAAKIDAVKTLLSYPWRQVFALTERIHRILGKLDLPSPDSKLKPIWSHSASEEALMSKLKGKKDLGVPTRQLWREMGYDEAKIVTMTADRMEEMKMLSASSTKSDNQ